MDITNINLSDATLIYQVDRFVVVGMVESPIVKPGVYVVEFASMVEAAIFASLFKKRAIKTQALGLVGPVVLHKFAILLSKASEPREDHNIKYIYIGHDDNTGCWYVRDKDDELERG